VWNWALNRRSSAYAVDKTQLNMVALSRELTARKTSYTSLRTASATALNNVLWDQDAAFQRFFKKQNRYPRFKKFGTVNSCCYSLDKRTNVFRDGECLKLPKLGTVKVIWSSAVPCFPNSATVSRTQDGKWFVSLQHESPDFIAPVATHESVGLDFGVTTQVATSDGELIKIRKPLKENLKKLARYQRRVSKAARGGQNRRKLKWRVARLHGTISNQRKDALHKLSTSVCVRYRKIAIEDLHVRGMLANGRLSRAVAECGFGELRRQLGYKSAWYGRELNIVPRFQRTTGVCPDCGLVGPKLALSERTWTCECGVVHHRDIAAARVIDLVGNTVRSTGVYAPGLAHKPDDSGTTRDNTGRSEGGNAQLKRRHGCRQAV
jgi:putative transposase